MLARGTRLLQPGLKAVISSAHTRALGGFSFGRRKQRRPSHFSLIDRPGDVSPQLTVPSHIVAPHYAATGLGSPARDDIILQPQAEIEKIRAACQLGRRVMDHVAQYVKPGVTTEQLDQLCHQFIVGNGAYPSPLNYMRFPKSICTSVNNVTVHGIPDSRELVDGDIISIDISLYKDGVHGDLCNTFEVGTVDDAAKKLIHVAKTCVDMAIAMCGPGVPLKSIGNTIEPYVQQEGYSVNELFVGHGLGQEFHTAPTILPYANREPGIMQPGMIFTIEPVVCEGSGEIVIWDDGWTAVTLDGGRAAQFEHSVLITEHGAEPLTAYLE